MTEELLKEPRYITKIYGALCSTIGTIPKLLLDDDPLLPAGTLFSRLTVKVRSLGTNTYIAVGTSAIPELRLVNVNDSYTFVAPFMNGNIVPFNVGSIRVLGDAAIGILEISGMILMRV